MINSSYQLWLKNSQPFNHRLSFVVIDIYLPLAYAKSWVFLSINELQIRTQIRPNYLIHSNPVFSFTQYFGHSLLNYCTQQSPGLPYYTGGSGEFLFHSAPMGYAIVRCLRRSAVNTLSEAIGFRPRKVVRLFSSASDITSNNFAIHSSANELLTTLTPVKSSTTRSFCSINGCNDSRTRLPKGRVPKYSPYSLKLNITIAPLIRCHSRMFHYIV